MKAKKLLSVLLVLAMVFTMMPMGSVVAQAVSTPLLGHEWICCDTTKEHYVIVAKNSPSSKADIYYYESNEWRKSASDQTISKSKFADYDNVAVGGIYVLEDTKYVVCKILTYTVTFDANGHGTAPDSYTDIEYEDTIPAPTEPTAEGYVFGGWYKESTCVTAWDFDSDEVTDDITLYAKWTGVSSNAPAGESVDEAACTAHPGTQHFYSFGTTFEVDGGVAGVNGFIYGTETVLDVREESALTNGSYMPTIYLTQGYTEGWYYKDGSNFVPCDGHNSSNTTLTVDDLVNAITGKKCVDIVDADGILCASGYDNVVEFFQYNSGTIENVKKVSDTVWTFDWIYETHTVNIYGEEHSFEEGACTKCHIGQTFTKEDMLAGLNGKECIKLIDRTIIASGYADVLAAIDKLGELSNIMYSTDDGEYWAFCGEDGANYVIYIYGEEHSMNGTECNVCGYKVTAAPKPLTFTAEEANSTITFDWASGTDVKYSTDGTEWTDYTAGTAITLANVDDTVSFKGTDVTTSNQKHFGMTGKIAASGDVTSLTNGTGGDVTLPDSSCYYMFSGCTALTAAPELPATKLAGACYSFMFNGCTALTAAPELPAKELADSCYAYMFQGCTALTAAPALSATTMAQNCYNSMFYGCTALTTAPALSAEVLAKGCYNSMFYGCTALTTAPVLDATVMANKCYEAMFQGCTSLTTAPVLPATALADSCYASMFRSCTALTAAPELKVEAMKPHCYENMFNGCTALTTAPKLPATSLESYCYNGMFQGCTALTTAPALPATELKARCYYNMFNSCTALTTAPELPATSLESFCYYGMFKNCTGLKVVETNDASEATWIFPATSATGWNNTMISGLTATGTLTAVAAEKMYKVTAAPKPLTFTADGDVTISLAKTPTKVNYEYSIDGGKNWKAFPAALADGNSIAVRIDQKVKAADVVYNSSNSYLQFAAEGEGTLSVSGDISSLLAADTENLPQRAFSNLFDGVTQLVDASELILPETPLARYCYQNMFKGCTALTAAPELKITVLANYCYQSMFEDCTSLTTAPELPSATMKEYCYQNMFKGCTTLTAAPELPATSLAHYCYENMFEGCTSLTAAPELKATTMKDASYRAMFKGCTSLTTAPALPATTLSFSCYENMFEGCTSLTAAPELKVTALQGVCYRSMFSGCTSLTAAPALPATTLANGCYEYMFKGCTSLTTAPALPATTLKSECYEAMFQDCTSLTKAPALPATTATTKCYMDMFSGCTALTDAPVISATTMGANSCNQMFMGCTSLTKAPALPATTLENYCYSSMFKGCTALTEVPELPATKLKTSCYNNMFTGCTALEELTIAATDISASDATAYWLSENTKNGILYLPNALVGGKNEAELAALKTALNLPDTWELALNPEPLTFTATGEVSLYLGRNITNAKFECSIDGGKTWNEFRNVKLADGESVMIRMDQTVAAEAVTHNRNEYFAFKASGTGTLAVSGNIMSMLPKGTKNLPGEYTFYATFSGMKNLTDASELLLPATELSDYCYMNMFNGCKALTKGPKLPATKMKPSCYYGMFDGCESLTEAPELPATELAGSCYSNMFQGCKALTKAPALPATKMETYCYSKLFNNCAALTEAPALPATELAASCYNYMFGGCKALTKAPALPATEMANYCYQVMFYNCSALETAPALPATTLAESCYLGMFQSCKALTKAPALPATELEKNCYKSMFYGCTGLTKAPALPATELAESCYGSMFNSCTALTRATVAATSFSAESCITDWLKNIETTGVLYVPGELLKDKTEIEINTLKTDLGLPETWVLKSIESDMLDLLDLLAGMTLTQQEVTPAFTLSVGETEEDSIPTLKFTGTPANENEFPFTFVSIEKDNDGKFIITGSNGNSSEGSVITISFDEETGVITAEVKDFPDGSPEQPNFTPLNGTYKSEGYVEELSIKNADNANLVTITLPEKTFMTADFSEEGDEAYIATYRQFDLDALDFDYYAWDLDETDTDLATAVANELEDYEGVEATRTAIDGLTVYYYDAEDEGFDTRTYLFQVDGKIHELVFFMNDKENEISDVEAIMSGLKFNRLTNNVCAPDATVDEEIGVSLPATGAVENITPSIKDNDLSATMDSTDLATIAGVEGTTVGTWVWLEVVEKDSTEVNSDDKAKIESALDGMEVGAYLDITLLKQAITAATSEKIAEPTSKVTISLTVPNELQTAPAGKNRTFSIMFTHNGGDAQTITPESYDSKTGTLTFKADKFSTYALVYTETNAYTGGGSSSNAITAPTSVEHGVVTVDKKSASSGETVTITVTPDKGYTLETLTVKDSKGNEVALTKTGDNTFTFKMPNGKVTIDATFMEDNSMLNFFVDVFARDYYYDAVLWAATNDITNGADATHFAPNATTTRAQMVTFLWRAAGCPEPTTTAAFADVSAGAYYAKAVAWAVENGITNGLSAESFAPDAKVTRAQTVTFMARMAKAAAETSNSFTDVADSAYYAGAVAWAVESGITNGTSASTFSPDASCTRGQIVTFLYRYFA